MFRANDGAVAGAAGREVLYVELCCGVGDKHYDVDGGATKKGEGEVAAERDEPNCQAEERAAIPF